MRESAEVIRLDVPQILQNPELPNGCEITSCCQLLRFWGYRADKCELADFYLPRSEKWRGADPDKVYMGDPHREDDSEMCGFYCFAGPVVAAANRYIKDYRDHLPTGAGNPAEEGNTAPGKSFSGPVPPPVAAADITGAEQPELEQYLRAGRPFLFWASLHFEDIGFDPRGSYEIEGGGTHRLFRGLHCMVCSGMDETCFTVVDPLDFNEKVPKAQFMKIYRQLGKRAAVLLPAGEIPGSCRDGKSETPEQPE